MSAAAKCAPALSFVARHQQFDRASSLHCPLNDDILGHDSFEQWEAEGSHDAAVRANERWKRTLREYVEPPLDEGVHEAIVEWMDRRKASFPDSDV